MRLDNASNIFLAARSDTDPKVFRISAEMDHDVDPQLLQEALDATYGRYRLYHAVLRSGVFWYYLQDSDLRPLVTAEELPTCAPIYQADRRTLLFRVMHHRQRILLEVFHTLSDGTGALWFLSDLVTAYVRLRHPEQDHPLEDAGGIFDGRPLLGRRESNTQPGDDATGQARELTGDSFAHYFRRRRRRRVPASDSAFGRAAAPAVLTVETGARSSPGAPREMGRSRRSPRTNAHRVTGTRTPDNRTRVGRAHHAHRGGARPRARRGCCAHDVSDCRVLRVRSQILGWPDQDPYLGGIGAGEPASVLSLDLAAGLLRDHPGGTHLRRRYRRPRLDLPAAREPVPPQVHAGSTGEEAAEVPPTRCGSSR